MLFFETSAKTADNVKRMFHDPAKIVHDKILNKEIDPANDSHGVKLGTAPIDMKNDSANLNDGLKKPRKGCCWFFLNLLKNLIRFLKNFF